MITADEVFLTAREYVGSPYRHQGRSKELGIDCIGLPILVCKALGLGDFDRVDYPRTPNGTLQPLVEEICTPETLQPRVLLLFKISATAQHCGIVSMYNNDFGLIHAWDIAERVVEHKLTQDWNGKIVGCYGLPFTSYLLPKKS
jgi:cell wall-associated NlpC family hydrolase